MKRLLLISFCAGILSACVQVQEYRQTSVNGQPVMTQESTTQISVIPGAGG